MRSTALLSWTERLAGLDPLPVPPHAFALGRHALRYGQFARPRDAAALELRELQSVGLDDGILGGGPLGAPLAEPDAFGRALDSLLARLSGKVERASLVLPDAWARALVVELGDLPETEPQRSEVLRFRLKRLVPFRADELRVAAAPLSAVPGQEEPLRALVSFASEGLLAALERIFAARGILIGQITGSAQALLGALGFRGRLSGLLAATLVQPEGFVLVYARDGEPLLWRQKGFTEGLADADRARMLAAELRLTRTFLDERLGESRVPAALLAAPAEVTPFWRRVLAEGLGGEPTILSAAHLPLEGDGAAAPAFELAPLLGAACREVA